MLFYFGRFCLGNYGVPLCVLYAVCCCCCLILAFTYFLEEMAAGRGDAGPKQERQKSMVGFTGTVEYLAYIRGFLIFFEPYVEPSDCLRTQESKPLI
jgi:hypothetical protein